MRLLRLLVQIDQVLWLGGMPHVPHVLGHLFLRKDSVGLLQSVLSCHPHLTPDMPDCTASAHCPAHIIIIPLPRTGTRTHVSRSRGSTAGWLGSTETRRALARHFKKRVTTSVQLVVKLAKCRLRSAVSTLYSVSQGPCSHRLHRLIAVRHTPR